MNRNNETTPMTPVEDKSHALINFSKLPSESRIKATAKQLTAKARDRDCLYKLEGWEFI